MGEQEDWVQPVGLNGLRPGEPTDSIFRVLDDRRWLVAEERASELIACIKPTNTSDQRRLAVADYVRKLIMQCVPCQVFTFGSVPLMTYLPDGDIDLTTFSGALDTNDSWPNDVRNMLESEEKNENAEFRVQEVQFIQAEVKIVKCLVENFVVDISFNQIGGICTLCFLEEVDNIISHNHLFKRSIILIKAWCYYESRILGAHHGLISTYALETLVLYIFHVCNDSFKGPLEVLYRFLEFFSKFDWENFCVSLWGPVPLSSFPEITAEPPRKDSRQLLLEKAFLEKCTHLYGYGAHQEQSGTHFPKRSFNVVDPLRLDNNLGRSVSKGNFFRIRSAFAFGAMKLARLLDCPEENVYVEVNQFFSNTWQRHANRIRPDAPCKVPKCIRPSTPDSSKCSVEERKESCSIEAKTASTGLNSEVSSSSYQKSHVNDHTFKHASKEDFSEDEQDHMKMMAPSMFHGFNGHFPFPLNMPPGLLPFAVPPSVLSSLNSHQKNMEGMFQGNLPLVENPWPTNMQFTAIPPPVSHYFQGTGMSEMNGGMNPADLTLLDVESKAWNDHDRDSYEGFHSENGTSEVSFDDRQPSLVGHQLQGKHESCINNAFDYRYQNRVEDKAKAEEAMNSMTLPPAEVYNSTLRRKTSGSSSDGKSSKVSSVTKERRGRKTAPSDLESAEYDRAKTVSEHSSTQPDNDEYGKDGKTTAHMNSIDRNELQNIYTPIGQNHQLTCIELPSKIGMETGAGHVSEERPTNNPGVPPFRFIPAGPPVPFLTMLTVYNVPNGARTGTGTKSNKQIAEYEEPGSTEDRRWDTFDSNLLAHLQILMYARACQTAQNNQRLSYPSQLTHQPAYCIPSDGSVRPLPPNLKRYIPFSGGDGCYISVAPPVTSMPIRPPTDYKPCVEEMPRYRGTGTYLPNPKISVRDRKVSGNRRVNYSYDRNDQQSDKGGNWNHNKPRVAGLNHYQNQYDKGGPRIPRLAAGESGIEKSWGGSYRRPDAEFAYQSQMDSLHPPTSSQSVPADVDYDIYSLPACSTKGVSPSLGPVPSLMMMYPYGQKVGYSPQPQVLEFGSLGPVELPAMKEYSQSKDSSRSARLPEDLTSLSKDASKTSADN